VERAWQQRVDVVTGITHEAQKRAEQVVRALVRRGEVEASRSEKAVENLLHWVDPVRRLGLAQQPGVDRLRTEISRLKARIRPDETEEA
jgi:hypothetical protein